MTDTSQSERTLYEVLGLEPSADQREIRSRYRQLAKGASDSTLRDLTEAISTLGNTTRRKRYDATLAPEAVAVGDIEAFRSTSTGGVEDYFATAPGSVAVSLDVVLTNIKDAFQEVATRLVDSGLDIDDGVRDLDADQMSGSVTVARRRSQRIRRAEEELAETQAQASEDRRVRIEGAVTSFLEDLEGARQQTIESAQSADSDKRNQLERRFLGQCRQNFKVVLDTLADADRQYEAEVLRAFYRRDEIAAEARRAEVEELGALSTERRAGLRQLVEDSSMQAARWSALLGKELSHLAGSSGQPLTGPPSTRSTDQGIE